MISNESQNKGDFSWDMGVGMLCFWGANNDLFLDHSTGYIGIDFIIP